MEMNFNKCLNELKSILYIEVSNYNKNLELYKELKDNLPILLELINILYNKEKHNIDLSKIEENKMYLGLLLPVIYGTNEGNRIYDMILNCLLSKEKKLDKLNALLNKLLNEYNETKAKVKGLSILIRKNKNLIIEYKRILSNYKYNGRIINKQVELIEELMNKYDFSSKDQIRIFESIRINNLKNKYNKDAKVSYTVVEMLDINLVKYDIDEYGDYSNKERFSKIIESFHEGLKSSLTIEDLFMLMPSFEDKTYSYEEFKYIYESVINKLIDDLQERIELIQNPEIYHDIELRKVVIQEFNEHKYKYDKLLKIYELRKNEYISNFEKEKEPKEEEIVDKKNILFYEMLPSNPQISYLEKDLKKYPEEYLNKVYELLENLKSGTLSREKFRTFTATNGVLKGYIELRDDQVRIMCKPVKNNYYCIIGAFVKKDDMDHEQFYKIAKRGYTLDITNPKSFEETLEKARNTEQNIYKFIESNARKGSR